MAIGDNWESFESLAVSLRDLRSVKFKLIARDLELRTEEDEVALTLKIEKQLWETLSDGLVQATEYAESVGEPLEKFLDKIRAMLKRTKDASTKNLIQAQHQHQVDVMIKEKKMIEALEAHMKLIG